MRQFCIDFFVCFLAQGCARGLWLLFIGRPPQVGFWMSVLGAVMFVVIRALFFPDTRRVKP